MRRAILPFALGFGMAAAGACGLKTDPVAPELVRPQPVDGLAAHSTPAGVELRWRRPVRYTGGGRMNDLGGFEIERAAVEGPLPWAVVGTLTLDDQTRFRKKRELEWVDTGAVPGARYRYQVTAFTLDGARSAPAGPVTVRFQPPAADAAAPAQETR
jgi:hypothetical protein